MAKFRDPEEIYRESLKLLTPQTEPGPPTIKRAEVWPYPELAKLWVRFETTPFVGYPDVAFTVYDPDGAVVSTMFMVEMREPYQSLTMHLRQSPREGEPYRLEIELSRDEQLLDSRTIPFDLIFRDPKEARAAREEAENDRTD